MDVNNNISNCYTLDQLGHISLANEHYYDAITGDPEEQSEQQVEPSYQQEVSPTAPVNTAL